MVLCGKLYVQEDLVEDRRNIWLTESTLGENQR